MGTTLNLFNKNSQTTEIKGTAKIGDFRYDITYNYDADKKITQLSCNVYRINDGLSYGSITINANRSVSLKNDADFDKAVAGFDSIFAEIQAGLATTGKATV